MSSSAGVKADFQPGCYPDDLPVLSRFLADLDQRVAHYTHGMLAVNTLSTMPKPGI